MDIDENAPGNVSQGDTSSTDKETGHSPNRPEVPLKTVSAPNNPKQDPAAKDNSYSPDFKSEPEHKPVQDADIDTQGG
ncbi:hypothetical protein [Pseudomonas sp. P1.8]|uniref:hypothetical protein n=1 Tax=Pseudomonas sp. P1.8 TaxID=1699310 RepID=UPI00069D5136|nr:hypothetical protein [Pseudomonas sp. P1.8]